MLLEVLVDKLSTEQFYLGIAIILIISAIVMYFWTKNDNSY